jgi:hypothetical protein
MLRATHVGGPMDGAANDVSLAAPATPERIYYAPAGAGMPGVTPNGYLIVGYERSPPGPWRGMVAYALDRERSELRPHPQYDGMEQGTAVYVLDE